MEVSDNELWKEAVLPVEKKKFRKEWRLQPLSPDSLRSKCSRFLAKKKHTYIPPPQNFLASPLRPPPPQFHLTKLLFVLGQFILGY